MLKRISNKSGISTLEWITLSAVLLISIMPFIYAIAIGVVVELIVLWIVSKISSKKAKLDINKY